jgi:hypothetical protein
VVVVLVVLLVEMVVEMGVNDENEVVAAAVDFFVVVVESEEVVEGEKDKCGATVNLFMGRLYKKQCLPASACPLCNKFAGENAKAGDTGI